MGLYKEKRGHRDLQRWPCANGQGVGDAAPAGHLQPQEHEEAGRGLPWASEGPVPARTLMSGLHSLDWETRVSVFEPPVWGTLSGTPGHPPRAWPAWVGLWAVRWKPGGQAVCWAGGAGRPRGNQMNWVSGGWQWPRCPSFWNV